MITTESRDSTQDTFADWQPEYAKHRIPIFPVAGKKPLVRGFLNTTPRRSVEFAKKFAGAVAFGFACGQRSGLTVVDMDSTDPAIVDEGEALFGASPLVWRTGGGKFAMAFRHNGERRSIRPIKSLPIDVLGAGLAIAPPSKGKIQKYEIIRGQLADIERLPVARMPEEIERGRRKKREIPAVDITPEGMRHDALKKSLNAEIWHCDDFESFMDRAMTIGLIHSEPAMPHDEIESLANWYWSAKSKGQLVRPGHRHWTEDVRDLLLEDRDAGAILHILRVTHPGETHEFVIANAMAEKLGMDRKRFAARRSRLYEMGLIKLIEPHTRTKPALWGWP